MEVISFPGEILLNILRSLVIPLIMCSVIVGIASLGDLKETGKLGARIMLYYGATTILAVVLGIIVVTAIQPGRRGLYNPSVNFNLPANAKSPLESILDVLSNMFPANLVEACKKRIQKKSKKKTQFSVFEKKR